MEANEFHDFKEKLDASGATLVAVSKTKSESEIQNLYDLGQRDFGENYVQELVGKQSHLPDDIRWHFIGHLQRNKVKHIASFVHMVQSIDSIKLVKEIHKQASKYERKIDALLQVHIADEQTKFGFDEGELMSLLPELTKYSNVRIRGLMGMATFTNDLQKVQEEFQKLKKIFDQCNGNAYTNWDVLNMGMSADYEIAINCGSTMVRIGSLLFGAREYD